ncbi:hypothetical protein ACO2Q2_11450 [Dyella sp. KRB-257]|uniref:hypothetical protein n=1 Tax=Dyella sp. KRB-257 TaxID=3400915 RepID=UPI003C10B9EC
MGVSQVMGTRGPLSLSELEESLDRHRVPLAEFRSGRAIAWNIAWELAGSTPLPRPVRYRHPLGAVTWVDLDEGTSAQILMQIDLSVLSSTQRPSVTLGPEAAASRDFSAGARTTGFVLPGDLDDPLVPVAKDQSWFGPHLLKAGQFTIGAKGEEIRVDSFPDALEALRKMKVPRWRRPNPQGNWGIVSGMAWKRLSSCFSRGAV